MKYINIKTPIPYRITDDTDYTDKPFYIPPDAQAEMDDVFPKVKNASNPIKYIPKLKELIKKYPDIPVFYNYLTTVYGRLDKTKEFLNTSRLMLEKFPEYIFTASNLCMHHISKQDIDKIPKILNGNLKIEHFAPFRKVFHLMEVVTFYRPILTYHILKENLKEAEEIFTLISEIAPETDYLEKLRMSFYSLRTMKRFQKDKLERESKPHVEYRSYDEAIQTEEESAYNHPKSMFDLMKYDFNIPKAVLEKIVSLPNITLTADLETMIFDGIRRYEFYSSRNDIFRYNLIHSIFLLAELKSEKSLDLFLELLRQGEELLRFWFGDLVSEDLWEIGCKLGEKELDKFKYFMCEPGIWQSSKYCISISVQQLYLNKKISKENTVKWLKDIIEYHLNNPDIENFIDAEFLSLLLGTIKNAKLIDDLSEQVTKLYNNNWILLNICGSQKDLMAESKYPNANHTMKILSIYDRYKILRSQYNKTKEEQAEEDKRITEAFKKLQDGTLIEELENLSENDKKTKPKKDIPRETVTSGGIKITVAKNAPCPCGSGKKYKRCCMK
jgi:hypothetical protein